MATNRCPECGGPQWKVPGSGWGCEIGHGFGEPNGPEGLAAATPVDVAVDCIRRHGIDVMKNDGGCTVSDQDALDRELAVLFRVCKHYQVLPKGDGSHGTCKLCGEEFIEIEPQGAPDGAMKREAIDAGDVITLTTGAEHYAPIRYHGFDCGPFAITVRVRAGESPHDAVVRARSVLDGLMRDDFERKVREHLARVRQAAKYGLESGIVVK